MPTECSKAPEDSKTYQIAEQLVVILTAWWRPVLCIVAVVFMNVASVSCVLLFSGSKTKFAVIVTSLTISVLSLLRFMNDHVPVRACRRLENPFQTDESAKGFG